MVDDKIMQTFFCLASTDNEKQVGETLLPRAQQFKKLINTDWQAKLGITRGYLVPPAVKSVLCQILLYLDMRKIHDAFTLFANFLKVKL